MADIAEMESRLKSKEREEAKLKEAVSSAWARRKAAQVDVAKAEEAMLRLRATLRDGIDSASWSYRKQKAILADLEAARKEEAEAAAAVAAGQAALEPVSDEVLRLKEELSGPRLAALKEKASGLWANLRRDYGQAVESARALVRLRVEAEKASAPRVIARKALGRALYVMPKDPETRESVARSFEVPGMPRGCRDVEYFRALQLTGPEGEWELVPDQDLTPPPPDMVEVLMGRGPLPEELAAVERIDLGNWVSLNGSEPAGRRGKKGHPGSLRRVTYFELAHEIQAERRKEGA